jgi:uncharacterized membrane protein YkvI
MPNDRLLSGLLLGGVSCALLYTIGAAFCSAPHTSPVHHGLVGLVTAGIGVMARDDFYTPLLMLSGAGMMFSDLNDMPDWLNIGTPQDEYKTPSY